jgi:hypothetical protein
MASYNRAAFAKVEQRNFRLRYELTNAPFMAEFERAGRRMGMQSLADVPECLRAYIWRKKRAHADIFKARQPGAYVTMNGRQF